MIFPLLTGMILRDGYQAAFKFPEYMERFIKQQKIRFFGFRIALWLTPLYLLIVPLAIFFYSRDIFIIATVCMILIAVISFQEYHLSKWILDYLQTNQPETDNGQIIRDKARKPKNKTTARRPSSNRRKSKDS